jgi:hypothetical protein
MAFKMKNQSMAKMVKAAGDSRVAMKMKSESAMKMKSKSPMEKELVGKQGNLPPELKAKIEAAPTKMKSALKKDDKMDKLMEIKRNTDPNDRDAVREINEKIRAHARKIGVKDVPNEETGGPRKKSPAKMKKATGKADKRISDKLDKDKLTKNFGGDKRSGKATGKAADKKGPMTMKEKSAMKKEGVDKNSARYKKAMANTKKSNARKAKEKELATKIKGGSDAEKRKAERELMSQGRISMGEQRRRDAESKKRNTGESPVTMKKK